jgi:signal transduction histidine kinase/PAS domain-containing protein
LWVFSASIAVFAFAAWQRRPAWPILLVAAVATLATGWFGWRVRRPRIWAMAMTVFLVVALGLAVDATQTLSRATRDYESWSLNEREARARRVEGSVSSIAQRLQDVATRVVNDASLLAQLEADGASAGRRLDLPLGQSVESAVLVFRDTVLIARTGQTRTAIEPRGNPGVMLRDDPFYSSLVARAVSPDGRKQVVVVGLMSAAPPADQFASALTQTVSGVGDFARTSVESPDSSRVEFGTTVLVVPDGPRRLARVRTTSLSEGEARVLLLQRARSRTAVPLAVAMICLLIGGWRRPARSVHRLAVTGVLLMTIAVLPLNSLSNVSALFDAASYFAPMAGPLTANAAALLISTALCLALVFMLLRSARVAKLTGSVLLASAMIIVSASFGPFLLRDLARGIALPANGVTTSLWIVWQLAIALAGATLLFVGAAAGRTVLGRRRGLPTLTAPIIALAAAVLAPVLWDAPGAWPAWYPVLWGLAIGALALTRHGAAMVTGAAVIAGAGAATLTWGATVRERMNLAQYDLTRLSAVDENAFHLIERLAADIADEPLSVQSSEGLLRHYAASELALAGYGARLARWGPESQDVPLATLQLAPVVDSIGAQSVIAAMARESQSVEIRAVDDGPTTMLIAAVPAPDGMVTTIAVPPRTRLLPANPLTTLTGIAGARGEEPPYRLTLSNEIPMTGTATALQWRRRGESMHGDGITTGGGTARNVHVEVELRGLDALYSRGALLVLLDVAVVLLLWGGSATADGAFGRWLRIRRGRLNRSFRVQLSAALLGFFVAPAALFAGWSWYRLQDDDRATRELLVRETLRTAASDVPHRELQATAAAVGSPLFVYHNAQLDAASDTLLKTLAPLGYLLPTSLDDSDFGLDDVFATRRVDVGASQALVGFRRVPLAARHLVLATPARGNEFALDTRRGDLGVFLLFTAALGALAATWLSGIAARQLARPVGALREAALALAAGREPMALGSAPATEFAPVYRAFGRMAHDLSVSREALEAAQRRTAAVLQHVASGVIALRPDGEIQIANPRAEELLEMRMTDGVTSLKDFPPSVAFVSDLCTAFLASDAVEDAFDHTIDGRQLRGRLTRLTTGAVLTLDDVTELASAQRVLAWGEMARQVAHEIKNPLTPIRLGVQHLRRAYRDGRSDFDTVLDTNVTRVLAEIDHLDEIARAFSRYGMAPDQRAPAIPVDIVASVRSVVALETLGEGNVRWTFTQEHEPPHAVAMAQPDELKEVLLNVLENARLAQASDVSVDVDIVDHQVIIVVRDNGQGIAPDVMPHVFEPHFSTRTSGSGLGLAISRRLIEGWGGRIALESHHGRGTEVRITLRPADVSRA